MNKKLGILLMALIFAMALASFTACGSDDDVTVHLLGITDDQIATYRAAGTFGNPGAQFDYAVRNAILGIDGIGNVTFEDWGWAETLDMAQRAAIAGGDAPLVVGGEIFFPTYASEDILYPLPADIVNSVVDTALIRNSNGQPVGVMLAGTAFMLFYNIDLMVAAGVGSTPPATWDEWQYMSERITAHGNGVTWGGGVPSFPHAGGALRATPFFRMLGVDFFQNGQLMINDPRVQQTLEFIRVMDANLPAGLGNGADEGPLWDAFNAGNIAFVVDGTWRASYAERELGQYGVNWGVTTLPLPPGGVPANCLVGVTFLGVPRAASDRELAFNIIRAALSEEVQLLAIPNGRATPLRSLHARRDLFAHSPYMTVAMDSISAGGFSGLASFPRNDVQIWSIINNQVIARTTMSDVPIETIVSEASSQIQGLLN
jgi:multiple sugar transport system substrate-binding protein